MTISSGSGDNSAVSSNTTSVHRITELYVGSALNVAQLHGTGRSANTALHFLRGTLDVYATYRRLERARELAATEERTEEEDRLLAELLADEEVARYLDDVG